MVQYSVTINIDPATMDKLKDQEFSLYAFKGISAGINAKSTVWIQLAGEDDFYSQNQFTITWEENFYIGETTEKLDDGAKISAISQYPSEIQLGNVYSYSGEWDSQTKKLPQTDSFAIDNTEEKDNNFYVTQSAGGQGVSTQKQNDKIIVVKKIFNSNETKFKPIETVAFILDNQPKYVPGSIVTQSFSPGVIVTLTGGKTEATVTYILEEGKTPWSSPDSAAIKILQPQTSLYNSMLSATLQAQHQLRNNWFVSLESREMELVSQLSSGKNVVVGAIFLKALDIAADTYIKSKLMDKFDKNLRPSHIDVLLEGDGEDRKVKIATFKFENAALILALAGTDAYESAVNEALTKAAQDPDSHILPNDWSPAEDNWTYAPHNVESTAAYTFATPQ